MDEICVVCLQSIGESVACRMVHCGHTFHSVCIQKWLVLKPACPICRSEIVSCQHGCLEAHDSMVLSGVIESQRKMIESLRTDVQILEDTRIATGMRMEIMQQDIYDMQAQFNLIQLVYNTPFLS
jgi:hypothetical protein